MITSIKRKIADWLWREREKHYTGSVFDRLRGLEPVLESTKGAQVLDVTSSDGLISYEFIRHGASLIHGLERNRFSIRFTRYLFGNVPMPNAFLETDLSKGADALAESARETLLQSYDIVLFLGIYHHLIAQMSAEELAKLVRFFLKKSKTWFVVRTDKMEPVAKLAIEAGFELVSTEPKNGNVGLLHVYRRK